MSRTSSLKVAMWVNIPSHYGSGLFDALKAAGVDLRVLYYDSIHAHKHRLAMGWSFSTPLSTHEQQVMKSLAALNGLEDWRDRVHVLPGYGDSFTRLLALHFSKQQVQWVHWSEPASPGVSWYLSYPIKRWYARMVNRYALGAFGIGISATTDFLRWGIDQERVSLLPYSVAAGDRTAVPDEECHNFCRGRRAFLLLGSLCRRKGTDLLLDAFGRASHDNDNWVLIMVGDDHSAGGYARYADGLRLTDRVLFRGPVSVKQLSDVINCVEVLVLPSRFDGWGVVVNEGASMGKALIASDRVGAAHHLIEPGVNGFRLPAGSRRALARALSAYMNDDTLAERHGHNSLHLFENYTHERNATRFVCAIQSWKALKI